MPLILDLISSTTHEEIGRVGWGNRVKVDSKSVMDNQRGWNIAILNENGALRIQRVFDTWAQRHAWGNSPASMYADLVSFLNGNVSRNDIVIIVVVDAAPYLNESQAAQSKFKELGVSSFTMERLTDKKYSAATRVEIPGWLPWIFVSQNAQSLIDKIGDFGSTVSASMSIETPTERASREKDLQLAAKSRENQATIAKAQAEAARAKQQAREAEIATLEALKAQRDAEKKADEAGKKAQEEQEKAEKERLAREEEKLFEHLEKCEKVAASQEKRLREVFPSLRDTVSFLRNMDRQKLIPEEALREMEEQLSKMGNTLKL